MKKGFTLVELLAVMVILSVVALITIVSVGTIISNSEKSLLKNQIQNIESSAEAYHLKEGNLNEAESCINVSDLIEKGYIKGTSVINPETEEEMNGSVKITYAANQYSYKYQDKTCSSTCSLTDKDKDGKVSLSDEITCGTESFYVMSNDGTNVTMLSKYNLNVGDNKYPNEATYGIQDEHIVGDDGKYGTVVYSKELYWGESTGYVYNSNSNLYKYVESYEAYLKNNGVSSASTTIMSLDQAFNLGCDGESGYASSCDGAPAWLYSTSYWLGNVYHYSTPDGYSYIDESTGYYNNICLITGDSWSGLWGSNIYNDAAIFGVRPVVTISSDVIK